MHRMLVALITIAAVAVGLAGCTTSSYQCSNDSCTVTLKGPGADTELYDNTVVLRLDGADGQSAEITVDDRSLSCTEGETVTSGELSITCDEVGDDEVALGVER